MAETLSLGFVLLQSAMQVAVFSLNVRYGLAVMTRISAACADKESIIMSNSTAETICFFIKITSLNIFDKNAFGDSYKVNAAGGDFLTKIFENMKLLFKQLPNTFGHI